MERNTGEHMRPQINHIPVHITLSGDQQNVRIEGDLRIPMGQGRGGGGIVLFAHGSGSSRFSPRNQYVASELNNVGLATLLVDLLTPEEERIDERTGHLRFDIGMLSDRLVQISQWIKTQNEIKNMNIGLFGASTGGGAAIMAASKFDISAVVSRGGRPDLAPQESLEKITCPTLLIVGGRDTPVIRMNQEAYQRMVNVRDKEMVIVPGATHLFEEEGKLKEVAKLASDWFSQHLLMFPRTGTSTAPSMYSTERGDRRETL